MEDQFYVDNLVVTKSDPVKFRRELTWKRLQEAGFMVQSCNFNCDCLRDEMRRDGTLSADE